MSVNEHNQQNPVALPEGAEDFVGFDSADDL
jgi:hypothetical protein